MWSQITLWRTPPRQTPPSNISFLHIIIIISRFHFFFLFSFLLLKYYISFALLLCCLLQDFFLFPFTATSSFHTEITRKLTTIFLSFIKNSNFFAFPRYLLMVIRLKCSYYWKEFIVVVSSEYFKFFNQNDIEQYEKMTFITLCNTYFSYINKQGVKKVYYKALLNNVFNFLIIIWFQIS